MTLLRKKPLKTRSLGLYLVNNKTHTHTRTHIFKDSKLWNIFGQKRGQYREYAEQKLRVFDVYSARSLYQM